VKSEGINEDMPNVTSNTPCLVTDFAGQPRRVFASPNQTIIARTPDEVLPALHAIENATRQGRFAVGFIAYEAAPAFDPAFQVHPNARLPLLWFGIFDEESRSLARAPRPASLEPIAAPAQSDFSQGVQTIKDAIAEGRTYQVNLTSRLRFCVEGDSFGLYEQLRASQGPGYHAFIESDAFSILSLSPELFFQRIGNAIVTRPMKGTAPRGRWREEDDVNAERLIASEKERAENLMIVDMMRNDLGRIAEVGTVDVPALFDVESYRTVLQMTSTVTANVRDRTLTDVLRALFPSGSVTGAPKIATMEMIAQLEDTPREVYCGAIGVVEPGGDCTFNVPIRTLWLDRATGIAECGVGAGITWDSDPEAEFQELRAKAVFLRESWPAFDLFETFRLERGTIRRLELHLARLRRSCAYFDFAWDAEAVRRAIDELTEANDGIVYRARLFIVADGSVRTSLQHLDPLPADRMIALAVEPVSSGNRFLFHKTTHRELYDRQLSLRPGVFDVVLWNERGQLTEFTRGNLVVDLNGRLCTPPRTAGLLAGVFREELLASGKMVEQSLSKEDLEAANAIWFINSLREWVAVTLNLD
jgi:para-aminobenzoate synthetase / 4-amino-4-deoxychorismate lyase